MKHLTPRRFFSDPHQMLIRLFNSMAGSFTQRALLISQSGSASSRLNVSSPPKGQGFHIRFSEVVRELIRERQIREEETPAEIEAIRAALIKGEKSGFSKRTAKEILARSKAELRRNGEL